MTTPDRADDARGDVRPEPAHGVWMLLVLSVLLAFASISTDLYLPALPAMGVDLGATQGTLELTISGYLAGFGIGQLFWGPVSDRFGRRGPIVMGIVVFVVGSAGCALAADAAQIIGWRVVQAMGASAGVVLARAMVRDLYQRDRAARLLSTLMTIVAVAPLLGPLAGAQLLAFASWRAIFWALVAIGVLTAAAVYTLAETLPPEKRVSGSPGAVLQAYRSLFANRRFLGYAGAVGFYYAGIFAIIAGTPFAYIVYYDLSPEIYAVLFSAGIVGLVIANVANARLVLRLGSDRLLLIGTAGAALSGMAVALATVTGWGGIHGLVATVILFTAMNGFVLANAVAGALSAVPTRIGAASAMVGAIQYGSGMVGSALVGIFANGTPLPMGCVVALAGIGSALCGVANARGRRGGAV